MVSRTVVNALSLSRIGLALLFVLTFQVDGTLFRISVAACVLALSTDLLDGYLARRQQIATIQGRLWDSLGDKAFYSATIIAFNAHGLLGPLVSWALIVREVALYITRILYIENLPQIEQIRRFTNWHGYFMYLTILLGLGQMYAAVGRFTLDLHLYMQISAYTALAFGIASIRHFIILRAPP